MNLLLATALLACTGPGEAPPPADRGANVPVLDIDTRTPEADLARWVRSQEDGNTRYSDASTGRTALYKGGALQSTAVELVAAQCPGALVALNALGEPAERQCDDRRWALDGGFAMYTAIEPDGGCLVSWDKVSDPLRVRALGGMADFRGAAYGSPRIAVDGLSPVQGDAERFTRPTDALDWGGVPLAAVRYHFDQDRLWQVELTPAEGQKQNFLDAWSAVFGPGKDGWWHGCDVNASFELTDPDVFAIRSQRITWDRSQRGPGATLGP